MIIDINQQTIDQSKELLTLRETDRGYICPVALRLHQLTGLRWGVGQLIAFLPDHTTVNLPKDESLRIREFDDDGVMEPHSFEFPWEPPAESEV